MKKMPIALRGLAFAGILMPLFPSSANDASAPRIPKTIQNIIAKSYPDRNLRVRSCNDTFSRIDQKMKKMPIALRGLAFAGILMPLFPSSANDASAPRIPKTIQNIIAKSYPDSTIVEHKDLDGECGEYGGKQPGLVIADFNGDRMPDYAVVLKHTKPRKHPEYGMLHDYKVVVFVSAPNQQFKAFVIWEYESSDKTVWFATLYKEHVLHDLQTAETIKLKNPAVSLTRCGGGFATYYWHGDRFKAAGGT